MLRTLWLVALTGGCQVVGGLTSRELTVDTTDGAVDASVEAGDCHVLDRSFDQAAWPVPADGPDGTSYVIDAAGEIVTDKITGLSWQAASPGVLTWEESRCACASSTLGGHRDWRLASMLELVTIVDYAKNTDPTGSGTTVPAINTTAFKGTTLSPYWTATPLREQTIDGGTPLLPYLLDFRRGGTSHATGTGAFQGDFRCVRGSRARPIGPRFAGRTDTVLDAYTSLEWQRFVSSVKLGSAEAIGYCRSLALDGQSDWTLPTVKQLASLLDFSGVYPEIDAAAFPRTPPDEYATSTRYGARPTSAVWTVTFGGADLFIVPIDPTVKFSVRCVRLL